LPHKRNAETASFTALPILFGNSNSAPGHLKNVWSQHSTHQNKSKAFFEASQKKIRFHGGKKPFPNL